MRSDKIVSILLGVGIILVVFLLLWDCLTPAPYNELTMNPQDVDWKSFSLHNVDVNALIQTLLSALIGFVLTIFFIEKLLKLSRDKEIEYKRQMQFKNVSKIIRIPLHRYKKASLSLVYGMGNITADKKIEVPITSKMLTNVYKPQAYADEPLLQPSIKLYARAVKDLQDCITNILLNVDLTDNEKLSKQLSDYVMLVSGINPCYQIINMKNIKLGEENMADVVMRELPQVDLDKEERANTYLPFKRLKILLEYHEAFIKTLYTIAPSFNLENGMESDGKM